MTHETEKWPTCHTRFTVRRERLTVGLVKSFIKFYSESGADRRANPADVFKTDGTARNNFQKLHYFSLIERTETSGVWQITAEGLEFLQNLLPVSKYVFVANNAVRSRSSEKVLISEAAGDAPFWLKKEDYVDQTKPAEVQANLFL
jgi:hypothetical protein